MASWKFTDQYLTAYPDIANTILNLLVFDVPVGGSPVNGSVFTGTLDLTATGNAMNLLAELSGTSTIPFTGTVDATASTLTVSLQSSDDAALTAAVASCIPLIGADVCKKVSITIDTIIAAGPPSDTGPLGDDMDIHITIAAGKITGTLVAELPMSNGFFTVDASFAGVGIGLDDLNFLVPGHGDFSSCFPSTQLGPYYSGGPALELLRLTITFYIGITPSFSVQVNTVTAVIGITNIALYKQALYLNPLGVWITIADVMTSPSPVWGLVGSVALCNYLTPGNTTTPDFLFDFDMGFPNLPGQPDFSVSAQFENPNDKPVSLMIKDLLGPDTDTGISDSITIEKMDFYANADVKEGTINSFGIDIGMSGSFGLFESFTLESFSLSVAYSS